jgi:hypothetical protein
MQPFSNQQLPFRYFDSDMAKKRPLVVSFRRIQKMTPNKLENCDSVSICDIHRMKDTEAVTMKMMSKCGTNQWRIAMQKSGHCKESQSCRNFLSTDNQKSQLDSLFDEKTYDKSHNDKGAVFPKEKFYGNAKLLLTMNDDILRTSIIDCNDSYSHTNSHRNSFSIRHLNENKRGKKKFLFRSRNQKLQTITSIPDDGSMIDENPRSRRALGNGYVKDENRFFETLIVSNDKKQRENETAEDYRGKLNKSSSAPSIFTSTRPLGNGKSEKFESSKASFVLPKSVSMLKIKRK